MSYFKNRHAFTLIECLLLVGIILLLTAMTIPAIMRARESSSQLQCRNQLRQIAIAIQHFHNDYHCLPPKRNPSNSAMTPDKVFSWRFFLLPYLEQSTIYSDGLRAFEISRITNAPPHSAYGTVIPILICPSDSRLVDGQNVEGLRTAFSSYLAVSGSNRSNGIFQGLHSNRNFSMVHDGLSNTLMIGERPPPDAFQAGQWYSNYLRGAQPYLSGPDHSLYIENHRQHPIDPCTEIYTYKRGKLENPCDRYHFWSLHPGGAHFAYADASVHFIPYSTSQKIMFALATSRGGEADVNVD